MLVIDGREAIHLPLYAGGHAADDNGDNDRERMRNVDGDVRDKVVQYLNVPLYYCFHHCRSQALGSDLSRTV